MTALFKIRVSPFSMRPYVFDKMRVTEIVEHQEERALVEIVSVSN